MANLITFARIALIVPFAAIFLVNAPWNMAGAFAVFVVAALSDFLDGWAARARGEVSALGAAIDPIADKLLVAAALILLTRNGAVAGAHVVAVLIIVLREIFVAGLREALGGRAGALRVSRLAKGKTAAQMIAAGALLAAAPNGVIGPSLHAAAIGALWAAAALTAWTGGAYALAAARALSRGPSAPEDAHG